MYIHVDPNSSCVEHVMSKICDSQQQPTTFPWTQMVILGLPACFFLTTGGNPKSQGFTAPVNFSSCMSCIAVNSKLWNGDISKNMTRALLNCTHFPQKTAELDFAFMDGQEKVQHVIFPLRCRKWKFPAWGISQRHHWPGPVLQKVAAYLRQMEIWGKKYGDGSNKNQELYIILS